MEGAGWSIAKGSPGVGTVHHYRCVHVQFWAFYSCKRKDSNSSMNGKQIHRRRRVGLWFAFNLTGTGIEVPDVESQKGGQPHARATAALQIPSHQSSHEIVLVREQGWPIPYNELLMRCSNLQKVSLQNLPLKTNIDFVSTCYYWYSVMSQPCQCVISKYLFHVPHRQKKFGGGDHSPLKTMF